MTTQLLSTVPLASTIKFRDKEFIVVKHNPRNTQIRDAAGEVYNLDGRAPVEVLKSAALVEQVDLTYASLVLDVNTGDAVKTSRGDVGLVSKMTADKVHITIFGDSRTLVVSIHSKLEVLTKEAYIASL